MTLVRRDNRGFTGWTRSRSSLRATLDAIDEYHRNPSFTNFNEIEDCIKAIPLAKQVQYSDALSVLRDELDGEREGVEQRELTSRLGKNPFRVTSDEAEYLDAFGEPFRKKLASLSDTSVWLDGGSGEAKALIRYLDKGGPARCIATGFEIPSQASVAVKAAIHKYAGRFNYVSGKFFGEISYKELGVGPGECDLISDLNGVLYYTNTLVEDLGQYLNLLKVNGLLVLTSIHIQIEMPNVEDHDRRRYSDFARWASNIGGTSLTYNNRTGACAIVKEADDIVIPYMKMTKPYQNNRRGNDPLRMYSCNLALPNTVSFL